MDEPFVMIPHSVLDLMEAKVGELPAQAVALYCVLVRIADFQTGIAYAKRQTLAARIGLKSIKAADQYITALENVGLIEVRAQWTDGKGSYSFIRSDQFKQRAPSWFKVVHIGQSLSPVGDNPLSLRRDKGGESEGIRVESSEGQPLSPTGDINLEPKTKNLLNESSLSRSTQASTAHPTSGAHFLPENWQPNRQHYVKGKDNGMAADEVTRLAAEFRRRMAFDRRRDWDKSFSKFITEVSQETDGTTYPPEDEES